MSRPPGLLAYLSVAALGAPTARRRIMRELARGGTDSARLAERLGQPAHRRPDGPLVWLHASGPSQEAALTDLVRRIAEAHDRASFLLTSDMPLFQAGSLPPRAVHQFVPNDASGPIQSFLNHWQPDVAFWAGTALRPALIHAAADRGTPVCLIDAAGAPDGMHAWQRFTGLTSSTLRRFAKVLATDDQAARALVEAGAPQRAVEITGPLEQEAATLSCNMRERDAIGAVLKARPVWLAVGVPESEEDAVIAAHRTAARLAHRLLLILVPADPARGPGLAERLASEGLGVALRSVEGEPEASTEVFVADSESELGLWYRLAPVTFMASTLDPTAGGGRSPLEPAALGSAILHGPHTGANAGIYNRFRLADAARAVADATALGEALSDLLSPDRAAQMAHAAWRVSTGGAEVSERVIAFVGETLASRAAG